MTASPIDASRTASPHAGPVQELAAWEREAGLFDYELDGVPLWRLVRSAQISGYLSRAENRGRDNYNRPRFTSLLHMLVGIARSAVHTVRLRQFPCLVVGFARRRNDGQAWVDTFFDPLIELMGEDTCLCIERPFVGRHFRPARTLHLQYYDWVKLVTAIAGTVYGRFVALRSHPSVETLAGKTAQRLGLPAASLRRAICQAYAEFRIERKCARYIVRRVSPKLLLLVNRGINFALIAACREHGVKIHEIQHGVMHVEGYKQGTRYDERIDPHGFLAFGEAWTRFDWGVPREAIRVLGYRYLWQRRDQLRRARRPHHGDIMLVSEPGCWQKLAGPFSDIVGRHPERTFVLKLHPQDIDGWSTRYPLAGAANVVVIDDPAADLYDLFGRCEAAVGFGSTALYEASFFGLKVCLLNGDGTNPSEAISFAGRYNFYEYRQPPDFDRMLESGRVDESVEGNPFFAVFDERVLDDVIR